MLGLSLGLILQVLVIAVQNSADYADLGAATSGATFFRSIGGAFGVAICGSVFSSRLATGLAAGLAGVRLPPGFNIATAKSNPALLKQPASRPRRARSCTAYSQAIDRIFLFAVPVAAAAFVLSWFLREVPLRQTAGAADLAEGLGAASAQRSSVQEIERALLRLADGDLRKRGYEKIAQLSGLGLPAGCCWVLARLAKNGDMAGVDLAAAAGVSVEHGRPYVDKLVEHGYVRRADGILMLTPGGTAAAERLFAAQEDGMERLLAGWSPEQHADLARMLDRLAYALLGDDADRRLISR